MELITVISRSRQAKILFPKRQGFLSKPIHACSAKKQPSFFDDILFVMNIVFHLMSLTQ